MIGRQRSTTQFYYAGDLLVGQKTGNDIIEFMFDSNGDYFGFEYNGTPYYYIKNLQGDVIAICNNAGNTVVTYEYDAWGRLMSYTDTTGINLVTKNPIRYRGYYFDHETGFYYLKTRYYSPEICRFLSPDVYVSTGQGILGYNMFAYCNNNPVNQLDNNGDRPIASTAVCYETTEERKESLKQMRACTNLNLTSNAHIETNTFLNDFRNYVNDYIVGLEESLYVNFGMGFGYGCSASLGTTDIEALLYINPANIKFKYNGTQYYSSIYIGIKFADMGRVVGFEYHKIFDWDTKEFIDISEDAIRFDDLGFGFSIYKHMGIDFYFGV